MGNIVEYIYKLQDKMSPTLNRIAKTAVTVATNMQKVKGVNQRVSASNENLIRTTNRVKNNYSGLIKMAGAYVGVMQAMRGVKAFTVLGMDMEQTRAKFEVLMGSMDKGNKMIADLNKLANATPYANKDLIKSSETMLAFGINAQKILPTMRVLGDVSMGNKEKLRLLTLAYSQVSSAGRLMGQDLLQMINQGFNPLLIISQKTGRSMRDLKDDMGKGLISFSMVEDAFKSVTEEGGMFFGMMDKMSKTSSGKLSIFLGDLQYRLTEVAERLSPFINYILDIGIKLVKNFTAIASTIWKVLLPVRALALGFVEMFKVIRDYTAAVMALVVSLGIFKLVMITATFLTKGYTVASMIQYGWLLMLEKATALYNVTLAANPILAVVSAVALLIGAFVILNKKTKEATKDTYDLKKATNAYAKDERTNLSMIFAKLRQTNPESKERNRLAKKLNEMYPDTLKNMNLEKAGLKELAGAYDAIVEAINKKAKMQAIEDRLKVLHGNIIAAEIPAEQVKETMMMRAKNLNGTQMFQLESEKKILDNASKIRNKNQKEINSLLGLLNNSAVATSANGGTTDDTVTTDDSTLNNKSGIRNLTGGGSRAMNVTINLKNLIENNTVHAATLKEGVDKAGDTLIEGLLRVVNSANKIALQ